MSTPPHPPDHPQADHPYSDASVRLARVADAAAIAGVQQRAWRAGYDRLLPGDAVTALDAESVEAGWAAAISAPPSPRHRVLVALEQSTVVGFAASAPAADPDREPGTDGELLALHVDPEHQRRGHGSRLMAALVDHARDDAFTHLVTWAFAADDAVRAFLLANGWDADGATRDLDVGELVHQVRLHTEIADEPRPA